MTAGTPFLDLLVVGGLTIDRFADGSSAPGGAVVHVARAAAARGRRVGIVTAAGDEPVARAGLDELRSLAAIVECTMHPTTTTFRHRESPDGRRLWFERGGGPVALDTGAYTRIHTRSILYAPVAGEVPVEALTVWGSSWGRGAILQGWLRLAADGTEVSPLPMNAISPAAVDALAQFNLLVASREDLLGEAADPHDQLAAMRRTFGRGPILVLTDGPNGLWLDEAPAWTNRSWRRHVPAPWTVEGVSSTGAGDILAAFLVMAIGDGASTPSVQGAMRVVAEELDQRKGGDAAG